MSLLYPKRRYKGMGFAENLEMRIVRRAGSGLQTRSAGRLRLPADPSSERDEAMKFVKARETLAALFALALVVLLLAVAAVVFGLRIPGLVKITDALGIS